MIWTLAFILVVALCAVMLYVASRMEPHWASKDGTRCICRGQTIDQYGLPYGRWKEYRVEIRPGGVVDVRPRSRLRREDRTSWRVVGKSDDPPARKAVFLLRSQYDPGVQMALRLPADSRTTPLLEAAAIS